jgi:hypothetical protein
MTTHFDDKGKFFTPVITKVPIAVIIQTAQQKIEGKIHIRPDERIKDEMDRPEPFLAVTDARVYNPDGTLAVASHFLTLNRAQIVWILPVDEVTSQV